MNAILIRVEILPKSVVLSDYFVPRQTSGNIWISFDCCDCGTDGIRWVEARDAVKHLMVHRTAPKNKG